MGIDLRCCGPPLWRERMSWILTGNSCVLVELHGLAHAIAGSLLGWGSWGLCYQKPMGPWLAILAASETEDCQSWVAVRDACLQSKTLATGGVLQEVCGILGQHGTAWRDHLEIFGEIWLESCRWQEKMEKDTWTPCTALFWLYAFLTTFFDCRRCPQPATWP